MKTSQLLPPLYRLAQNTLCRIEEAVRLFPRYHKYTLGSDLRRDAMQVMRRAHRAVYDKNLQQVTSLLWAVEELKITLQLAREVNAFQNMRTFATIAEMVAEMGRQCGGWQRAIQRAVTKTQVGEGQQSPL